MRKIIFICMFAVFSLTACSGPEVGKYYHESCEITMIELTREGVVNIKYPPHGMGGGYFEMVFGKYDITENTIVITDIEFENIPSRLMPMHLFEVYYLITTNNGFRDLEGRIEGNNLILPPPMKGEDEQIFVRR